LAEYSQDKVERGRGWWKTSHSKARGGSTRGTGGDGGERGAGGNVGRGVLLRLGKGKQGYQLCYIEKDRSRVQLCRKEKRYREVKLGTT